MAKMKGPKMHRPRASAAAKSTPAPAPASPSVPGLRLARDPNTKIHVAIEGVDLGPIERRQHGAFCADAREADNDEHGAIGLRAVDDRLTDRLIGAGALGDGDELDRRIEAIGWLRNAFTAAKIIRAVTAAYNAMAGLGRSPDDMTDREAANHSRVRAMFRELPTGYAALLVTVVCYDEMPAKPIMRNFNRALDALADWRGL